MLGLSIGFGTAGFVGGAVFIKYTRAHIFSTYTPLSTQAILYLVSVPVCCGLVQGLAWSLGPQKRKGILKATVIATVSESLLNSVALVWAPNICFGGWKSGITKCCAWILWTVASAFVYALYLDHVYNKEREDNAASKKSK
ncbi:hypothetical protein BCR33DRAFT_720616 [Rhizoclosmatium globosum]|uniref:Uncharacterized protein n=1 Tax=Rhizoclosmatium globosum TaxID=329046 RepID=A0A1Y2BUY7_9FUNG|nr:hypothetical protein BCR33DRAFT_720616 [Rhizoclosmatium globosum]|eukprot:ORY38582.1 hypothetical protein BCR33DRAFT_720616 [Rhizoclosmatium globosum]